MSPPGTPDVQGIEGGSRKGKTMNEYEQKIQSLQREVSELERERDRLFSLVQASRNSCEGFLFLTFRRSGKINYQMSKSPNLPAFVRRLLMHGGEGSAKCVRTYRVVFPSERDQPVSVEFLSERKPEGEA